MHAQTKLGGKMLTMLGFTIGILGGVKEREKITSPTPCGFKNFFEFFKFLVKKGSFLDFYWTFMKFENCFGIIYGIFGGVKEKEKINLTTPYGFKMFFF